MTKILLVEDDKNLREIYGTRLNAEGYTIVSAGDGEEALAIAIKERPDLIISDVMMPKISGFDMLDILRSTTETKNIRVIMMTALSSEDQRQRGEALGADRYLVKSQVGIEDVVRTVHEILADSSTPVATPAPAATSVAPIAPTPMAPAPIEPQPPVATPTPLAVPPRQVPVVAAPVTFPTQPVPAPVAPAPIAAPEPVAVIPPVPAVPVMPVETPTPVATPAPAAAPVPTFAPQDQPAPVQLPQPTAPFSTPRPLGLGDRIIQPLPSEENVSDTSIADRIEAALGNLPNTEDELTIPPVSVTAPTPPASSPIAATFPPVAVPGANTTPPLPGLAFEETPRPATPQQPTV